MSFQQGLSGLNATSKQLDVIGNNISNASTVGFKMAQAQFADVFANSLSGAGGGNTVGIGVRVQNVSQLFTQGNITSTNNPLDMAINGSGFFRISNNGSISYSRNGQFSLDKNGYIVNAQGAQLTGYMADGNGVLSTGAAVPLNIDTRDIAPKQTEAVNSVMNLDSRSVPPAAATVFSMTDPTTYTSSTSVAVFDSLGNSHVLQTFFVRIDPALRPIAPAVPPAAQVTAEWDMFAAVDGVKIIGTAPAPAATDSIGTIGFDAYGKLASVVTAIGGSDPNALQIDIPVFTGAVSPIGSPVPPVVEPTLKYDMTGMTQYGSPFSVNSLKQDGYASGKLSKFNTSKDGTIVGSYTNGRTSVLGQVAMANFTNPNGLQSLGDNQWAETSESGNPLVGVPGSGSLGVLTSNAVEDSNTDLTGELVNMITAQRVYQANAQTIKTQDQVLQTLVNLR